MKHQICDACETVAHCKQHGCIPVQPTTNTEAMRAALRSGIRALRHESPIAWAKTIAEMEAALAQAEQRQEVPAHDQEAVDGWRGLLELAQAEIQRLESVIQGTERMIALSNAMAERDKQDAALWRHWKPWIERRVGNLDNYAAPQPEEIKQHAPGLCKHASRGCNYPEGECSGGCLPSILQRQAS